MKRKHVQQSVLSLLLVFLLALSLCGSVFAANGDGSGGGGGNGSGSGSGTAVTTDPGTGDGTGGGTEEPLALVTSTPSANATQVAVDEPIKLEFSKNVAYATVRDANLKAVTLWAGNELVKTDVTLADDQLEPDLRNFITITPVEPLKEGTVYTIKVDTTLAAKSGAVLSTPLAVNFTTLTPAAPPTSNYTVWIVLGALAVIVVIVAVVLMKRKKA